MTCKALEHTKVLILCCGEGERWANHLGIPKQLISINGESLLNRMVRLLRDKRYDDIAVISHDERLRLKGCDFYSPPGCRWVVETLLSTHSLWAARTLVLLGDVFFTEQAINTITKLSQGIHIYGRPGASKYTFTPYGEIFSISFDNNSWDQVVRHAEKVCCDARSGGRGKLWEFYRSLAGFPLNEHRIENEIFHSIHDLTDDIDDPDEYNKMIRRYTYATSNNPYKRMLIYSWIGLTPYLFSLKTFRKSTRNYASKRLTMKNH